MLVRVITLQAGHCFLLWSGQCMCLTNNAYAHTHTHTYNTHTHIHAHTTHTHTHIHTHTHTHSHTHTHTHTHTHMHMCTELQNLAELIGPYEIHYMREKLMELVAAQVAEIKKLVIANQGTLIALYSSRDKPEIFNKTEKVVC